MMIRIFDFLFSAIAIIALIPIICPIIVLLKFTGEGEIFFLQERVGKNFEKFNLFKFATMLKDSPNIGSGTVTMKNDPRILPMGNLLRKTKINELPQILNIFLGHMSFIGPRPQTQRCFDAFPKDDQFSIASIKPGLSGIGSIIFRGEEDLLNNSQDSLEFYDHVISPYKGKIESWYTKNNTIINYFILIFCTIWVVFKPKSQLIWNVFKSLPKPPDILKDGLNYPKLVK
tara:strand:+ start:225 stop:914 length:690 start_codon:yes stop_codon:yes gene_type:complete